MKFSLLCLYIIEELEEHNIFDLIKTYKRLGTDISHHHLELIFRRGLSISYSIGKLPSARKHWEKLKPLAGHPELVRACERALTNDGSFKDFHLSDQVYK